MTTTPWSVRAAGPSAPAAGRGSAANLTRADTLPDGIWNRPSAAAYIPGVRKFPWLVVTAVVLLLFTAAKGLGGFFLGAVIVGVPYLIGCVFHPRTIHGSCRG